VTNKPLPSTPTALMFAPMIYLAWSDGDLEDDETRAISQHLSATSALSEECRSTLATWLDPGDPPSARDLASLLELIRKRAGERGVDDNQTLRELAVSFSDHVPDEAELSALRELERAIGLTEKERALSIMQTWRPQPIAEAAPANFEVTAMTELLNAPHAELRSEIMKFLAGDAGAPLARHNDLDSLREQTQARLKLVADRGWGALAFPESCGGENSTGRFLAAFETLGYGDLSLMVKFGVQFGLFGLSVKCLGTERHHNAYLPAAGRAELPGCFAMTETGHGSNVNDLETTATYDAETQTFVIDTPHPRARKDYIGNAGRYGRVAVVFAQLKTQDQAHGVHAFAVPIRNEDGSPCDGVEIEDCGGKLGLEGVDNGRLAFNKVSIGRGELLDRYASVAEDGTYDSPIASAGKRFFTMLGALVGGRIAVGTAALSASKLALTIALRYASRRRQFGPRGAPEVTLIQYPYHRRRLLPRFAETIALHAASRKVGKRFADLHDSGEIGGEPDVELETAAAAIKALATWHASSTIGECREACGGRGYLAGARFAALKADTDVFTTFEGDNVVLLQLVAKSLLTDFSRGMRGIGVLGLARFVTRRAIDGLNRNPVTSRRTGKEHLRDAKVQGELLGDRKEDLLFSLAKRIKKRMDEGHDAFFAMIQCQEHVIALGRAQGEWLAFEAMVELEESAAPELREMLGKLRSLYALTVLERDRGWFLENGYFEPAKSGAVRDQVSELCAELADQATHLVDALGIPDDVVRAQIGLRDVSE